MGDERVVEGRAEGPGTTVPQPHWDAATPADRRAVATPRAASPREFGTEPTATVTRRSESGAVPVAASRAGSDSARTPDDASGWEPATGPTGAVARVEDFRTWLATVDVHELTDAERVTLLASLESVKGAASAAQARATDAFRCSQEHNRPQDSARSVGSQIALARREPPTLGNRFVGLSRALVHEMPHTMTALTTGAISERHAVVMAQATACLSVADRGEVDSRLAGVLGRLGVQAVARAAARVTTELDAASIVRRMEAAARSRRVTTRPAPDGMAYLTVLGPLKDIVGAYACLQARAKSVVGGHAPDEAPDGRGVGAVMTDTALQLLSGRAIGQTQPVEVNLVITDRALLGTGDPTRDLNEPARIPGHGPVPAPVARAWLRNDPLPTPNTAGTPTTTASDTPSSVWLRRLYTTPDGRDLVAMDSHRRTFTGLLRRMLILRDDVCATPWCNAPIIHADHTHPARDGGPTTYTNGTGDCARCNHVKEAPAWRVDVRDTGLTPGHPRTLRFTTPTGHTYNSTAPPLTGWGWKPTNRQQRPRTRRSPRASPLERAHINRLASA